MSNKTCTFPLVVKNKFVSSLLGTVGIYFGICFILPISQLSVYITSYIHLKQDFVNMHYGYFLSLILTFTRSFSVSLGGLLENKFGFSLTTLIGTAIVLIGNIFFFRTQNIWFCYFLTFVMGLGAGIATSLVGKNLTLYFPKKKGLIVSFISLITILFSAGYVITGEKIIAKEGETLGPEDEYYSSETAERTYLFFLIGFFSLPVGDVLFILFSHRYIEKNEESIPAYLTAEINEKPNNENIVEEKNEDIEKKLLEEKLKSKKKGFFQELKGMGKQKRERVKKILKTFRFWRIAIVSLLLNFSISFMITTGRTFGAIIGISGGALQFLSIVQSGSIILIGPIFGILSDKKGPLLIVRICAIVSIFPGIILLFFMDNTALYMLSFVLVATGLVSKMVSFNPLLMEIYGIEESVILSGIINGIGKVGEIATTIAAFVISFFYTKDEIKTPYKVIFTIGSVCSIVSTILLFFESNEKFDYKEDQEDKDVNEIEIDKLVDTDTITESNN